MTRDRSKERMTANLAAMATILAVRTIVRVIRRTWWPLLGMLIAAPSASAYEWRPTPPLERMEKADLVIVGRPLQSRPIDGTDFIDFRIELVLKGESSRDIRFRVVEEIAEANFRCCEAPQYLLFLRKLPHGEYSTSDGRYGVWPIPSPVTQEDAKSFSSVSGIE